MLWEQIFNAYQEDTTDIIYSIKEWGRNVVHIAWGNHMWNRLVNEWGVAPNHVFLTGQVTLDYLRDPLKGYYQSREEVFLKYGIPTNSKVHLFISSLAYADAGDRVIKNAANEGDNEGIKHFAEISVQTRNTLVNWFERILEENKDDVVIYRPHPEEKENKALIELMKKQPRFRVISELSVKQWILICDNIYSWISTAIAEVYAAGKGCAILRPVEVPYNYDIKMYHFAKQINTYEEFKQEFHKQKQELAIDKNVLNEYYKIREDRYSYELVCDAIEKCMNDEHYEIVPPLKNPLLGGMINGERLKNVIKRWVTKSSLMNNIYRKDMFKGSRFRELLDDIFYVKEKLEKNNVTEQDISNITARINKVFENA